MIVPAMNSEEIIKEVVLDLPKVKNKIEYCSKDLRRAAIKSKSKFIFKWIDYKSPRKNDWVILLKSTPSVCSTIKAVHYWNKMGFNCLSIADDGVFHHYSSHFLERYNERFLNQYVLSRLDLFKYYINHNSLTTAEILSPDEIEIKRIILKINDGIAFGTMETINVHHILDYRTFISNDMVLDFQKKDVDYISHNYEAFCNENPVLKKMEIL